MVYGQWSLPLQRCHPWSNGAMGIERAIKAMAPSATTGAPTATTLKVTVVSLTGETLLQEEPMGVPSGGTCSTYHMDPYGLIY